MLMAQAGGTNQLVKFIERMRSLLGPDKIKFVTQVSEYELKFVLSNFKEHSVVTLLAMHEEVGHATLNYYAKKFEEKFGIPVFMGEVWDLWP